MKRSIVILTIFLSYQAAAQQFSVDQLPIGGEVTVPPTARTLVPMGTRVKLTSTDAPQTIHLSPVGNGSTFATPIEVAIFDTNQDRVKYVQVNPNSSFLYSFKGLSSISLQPNTVKSASSVRTAIQMQIESDKAVTIAR